MCVCASENAILRVNNIYRLHHSLFTVRYTTRVIGQAFCTIRGGGGGRRNRGGGGGSVDQRGKESKRNYNW